MSTTTASPDIRLAAPAAPRSHAGRHRGRAVAPHEFLPTALIYAPVVAQWLWLALRYRGTTLPCLANPHIVTGGLCGESKTQILDAVPGEARAAIAPYEAFIAGPGALAAADAIMARRGLGFPVVLKPDVGCRGAGVRLIGDRSRLAETLASFEDGVKVLLQEFIPWEGEAGIFYSRRPGAARGRVCGMGLKHAPFVEGDGIHTLRQLIAAHPRAGQVPQVYLPRLERRADLDLERVLPAGERFRLVFTGNHEKGSVFRDGSSLVTPALEDAIEAVLGAMPDFHHGRVDLRYADLASLQRGENFRIIEINGIGAEPIQMWDPEASLGMSLTMLMRFWREAFRIGASVRQRGHRAPRLLEVFATWREEQRLIAAYPSSD